VRKEEDMGLEVAGFPYTEQPFRVQSGQQVKASVTIQAEERTPDRKEAEKYLNDILDIAQIFNRKLKFSINEEIDRIVVKVIDKETDKVIKEIPPVELQHLYARMKEAIGLIVDEKI